MKSLTEIYEKYDADKRNEFTHPVTKETVLGHNFVGLYDVILKRFRKKKINFLVLGIGSVTTGCVRAWSEYFTHPKTSIRAADYDKSLLEMNLDDSRVELLEFDQKNDYSIQSLADMEYDIIIDDCSHENPDINRTIDILFPKLKDDGLYVVEDTYHSFDKPNEYTFMQHIGNKYIRELNETAGSGVENTNNIKSVSIHPNLVYIEKGKPITR
tara:strand:+ start:6300 stop:6938 length:639 start_codon:yes stop_codon:yes gene_type:complete